VGILFAAFLAVYVRDHLEDFRSVLDRPVPPLAPALLALCVLLTYSVNAAAVRLALLAHSVAVPGTENLALTLATSAANTFLPFKGAAALRAYYLFSRHGLQVTDFLSMSFLVGIAALAAASLAGLAGLLAVRGLEPGPALALEGYFAGTFLLAVALVFSGSLPARLPGKLGALCRSWVRYRERPGILMRVAAWDAAFFLFLCLSNRLSLQAFGVELSPAESLFWSAGQMHTLIINLTPAGLGVMEAWSVFAGQLAGFTPAEALLAQGLFRLETFLVLGATGIWGWLYLARLGRRVHPSGG
jgi:uncharacterized membrane protein YbhN (UPF0104 family)